MASYTQQEFQNALGPYDKKEIDQNDHDIQGAGNAFDDGGTISVGATPKFRWLRIWHTYDDRQFRFFKRRIAYTGTLTAPGNAASSDAQISISEDLPPSTGDAPAGGTT